MVPCQSGTYHLQEDTRHHATSPTLEAQDDLQDENRLDIQLGSQLTDVKNEKYSKWTFLCNAE